MEIDVALLFATGDVDAIVRFVVSLTVMVAATVVETVWVKMKENNRIIDNHGKECRPLNKRVEDGGFSYDATCSLCGGRIGLWPHCDDECPKCCATVVH